MTRIAAGLALAALSLPLAAAPEHFLIDPARTVPAFEVSRLALPPIRGRLARVTGSITLDMASRAGEITIEIDTTSVDIASLELEGGVPVRAEGSLTRDARPRFSRTSAARHSA